MEPGAELALLRWLSSRERYNRLQEWWREAKKHPFPAIGQLLMLGFMGAMFCLFFVLIRSSPDQIFNLQPGRDYEVGAVSAIVVLMLSLSAGYSVFLQTQSEMDILYSAPVRRKSIIISKYRDLASLLVVVALAYAVLGMTVTVKQWDVSTTMATYRFIGGIVAFAIIGFNSVFLLRRALARANPERKNSYLNAAFLGMALLVFAPVMYLFLLGFWVDPTAAFSAFAASPLSKAMLFYITVPVDVMYFAPAGPLLALEALGLYLMAIISTALVLRSGYPIFEERGIGTGREMARSTIWSRSFLGRIHLSWPGIGPGARAMFSLNLMLGMRTGVIVVMAIPTIVLIIFGTLFGDMETNSLLIILPLGSIPMMIIFSLIPQAFVYNRMDFVLMFPVNRFRLAAWGTISGLVMQLIGWYTLLALLVLFGAKVDMLAWFIYLAVVPLGFLFLGAMFQHDIVGKCYTEEPMPMPGDATPMAVQPGMEVMRRPADRLSITGLVGGLLATGMLWLYLVNVEPIYILVLLVVSLAGLSFIGFWATARRLERIIRVRTPWWKRVGADIGTFGVLLLAFILLILALGKSIGH